MSEPAHATERLVFFSELGTGFRDKSGFGVGGQGPSGGW